MIKEAYRELPFEMTGGRGLDTTPESFAGFADEDGTLITAGAAISAVDTVADIDGIVAHASGEYDSTTPQGGYDYSQEGYYDEGEAAAPATAAGGGGDVPPYGGGDVPVPAPDDDPYFKAAQERIAQWEQDNPGVAGKIDPERLAYFLRLHEERGGENMSAGDAAYIGRHLEPGRHTIEEVPTAEYPQLIPTGEHDEPTPAPTEPVVVNSGANDTAAAVEDPYLQRAAEIYVAAGMDYMTDQEAAVKISTLAASLRERDEQLAVAAADTATDVAAPDEQASVADTPVEYEEPEPEPSREPVSVVDSSEGIWLKPLPPMSVASGRLLLDPVPVENTTEWWQERFDAYARALTDGELSEGERRGMVDNIVHAREQIMQLSEGNIQSATESGDRLVVPLATAAGMIGEPLDVTDLAQVADFAKRFKDWAQRDRGGNAGE